MASIKNLSPRQVAAVNAATISLMVALANLIFIKPWWTALITFVVLFIVAYLLIYQFLERFIYRRIKLIYKFIHQTKANKRRGSIL
jgi:two-component system phosphate regulon sensor histidine kinase PhoR